MLKSSFGSASLARPALTKRNAMFVIVRKFRLTRGSAEEVARRVQESFVPLLRELPGFRSYHLFEGGPDVLISIRLFDTADAALASHEVAASWIRNNVLEFVKGMPEIMAGDVLVSESR
jgi:Antibiotic biosynthesis monooxygenase